MSPIRPLSPTPTGTRRQRVTFQNPGPPIPTPDGGYTDTWTDLEPPAPPVSIRPATVGDLERITAGTVVASATHLVRMPYHAAVGIQTRLLYGARRFSVVGVINPEERNRELILTCAEVIP